MVLSACACAKLAAKQFDMFISARTAGLRQRRRTRYVRRYDQMPFPEYHACWQKTSHSQVFQHSKTVPAWFQSESGQTVS